MSGLRRFLTALRRRLFGDDRVIYQGCGLCHGQGCKHFTKERLSKGVRPLMTLNYETARLATCAASVIEGGTWAKHMTDLRELRRVIRGGK